MNTEQFHTDITNLVALLILDIRDDYRANDDDDLPSMGLTVGVDADSWGYQTGDNSYSGSAYHYSDWAVVTLYRDSIPSEVADDIVNQIADLSEGEVFT